MTTSACHRAVRRCFKAGIGLFAAFHAFGYVFASEGATTASWYDNASAKREGTCHVGKRGGCLTASGRELDDQAFTAASWDYPFGTPLAVCRTHRGDRGDCVQVVVTDRGPAKRLYRQGRILDLSKAAFAALAPLKTGIIEVSVEPLP